MPTSRQILDLLTRDELAHLVEQNEINLGGKAKGHMLDKAKIVNQDGALRQAAGQHFYNSSPFMLRDLKARVSQQALKADIGAGETA